MEMHKDAIVKVDRCTGMLCLFLNIFVAGLGTIVASYILDRKNSRQMQNSVIVGGLQFILFFYGGLGWFWSVYTGWLIYTQSEGKW